jgi:hypothetical protein
MQKLSIVKKVPAQDLGDAENEMPMGDLLEHMCTEPLSEFHHPLLMAGGEKMTTLAGEGQKVLVVHGLMEDDVDQFYDGCVVNLFLYRLHVQPGGEVVVFKVRSPGPRAPYRLRRSM